MVILENTPAKKIRKTKRNDFQTQKKEQQKRREKKKGIFPGNNSQFFVILIPIPFIYYPLQKLKAERKL